MISNSWQLGAGINDGLGAVAARPEGGAVACGSFEGALTIAGAPLASTGGRDGLAVELGSTGPSAVLRHLAGTGTDFIRNCAITADGAVVVTGSETTSAMGDIVLERL